MRPSTLFISSVTTALITLVSAAPAAHAAEQNDDPVVERTEAGPVEVTVAQGADGEITKTVVIDDDDDSKIELVETEDDGDTRTVVTITDGDESMIIVDTDGDHDDDDHDIIEEEIIEEREHDDDITWLGLQGSVIFSPAGGSGRVSSGDGRLRSNQFKACADPSGRTGCGYVKGMDFKVQMFKTGGSWSYPRFVGYFRTGFEQGRAQFQPPAAGFAPGQTTRLDYTAVPLFLGGNVYLFEEFPIRPYAGLGFGFDVLRLDYRRAEQSRLVDASARVGFELHAGVEARITNYIALHAEVMQRWSARRKLDNRPDFSNTGLGVLAGVTVGIPVGLGSGRHHHKTVRRVRRQRSED